MRAYTLLSLPVLALGLACSSSTTSGGDGACGSNDECGAGQVCTGGTCISLCSNDLQCDPGNVCQDSTCVPGARQEPTITAVNGDSMIVCPDAMGTHCMDAGLIIDGTNLAGASFSLSLDGGGAPMDLVIRSAQETRAEVNLPNIDPGNYTLVATNQAGTDQTGLTLLQGPPGPDLTANEMVTRLNTATSQLVSTVLPVGSGASDVAAGVHTHDGANVNTGTVPFAQMPVGTAAGTVSEGDHSHMHNHDADYLNDAPNSVQATNIAPDAVDWTQIAGGSGISRATIGTYSYQAGARVVNLGWEPDFVIIARQGTHASMMAFNDGGTGGKPVYAFWATGGLGGAAGYISFQTTGFTLLGNDWHNQSGYTHRFMAMQFR